MENIGLGLELRQQLNRISWGLSSKIHEYLSKINVQDYSSFELIDVPSNHRYIKFKVDSKIHRFNYLSKKDFLSRNFYWFQHKPYPFRYRYCVNLAY